MDKFWRVESHRDDGKYPDKLVGKVCHVDTYQEAMRAANNFLTKLKNDRIMGYHCVVIKCGGTPLQCCIDGTEAHYVYV